MPRPLHGVLGIVQTPFTAEDELDLVSLQREVDWAMSLGAHGLGTGMVSEILRLTTEERRELTARLVEFVNGRGAVFAAVGAESARQAVEHARQAERVGCDAVMAAPPTTARLGVEGLVGYYRALADAIDVPVIVQDASAYVGQAIPLSVYLELLERYGNEKILFKPEASPIGPKLSELRDATSGQAKIFDGSGGILLVDCYRRGITGTMPGCELLDAQIALWIALERADDEAIYDLYLPICAIVTLQMQAGLDGFLAVEKDVLFHRGLIASDLRRSPNGWSLDRETAEEVQRLFARLQDAVARQAVR